jgi:hypothetical protein
MEHKILMVAILTAITALGAFFTTAAKAQTPDEYPTCELPSFSPRDPLCPQPPICDGVDFGPRDTRCPLIVDCDAVDFGPVPAQCRNEEE